MTEPATFSRRHIIIIVGLFVTALFTLWMMGRVPICTCGTVKLWFGPVVSDETSQHLTDWYTLSHINHGFLYYGGLWLLFRRWSIGTRLSMAVAAEGAWEIFENTDFIINRYRELTISLNYFGDSVVNSAGDILAMIFGFLIASRAPAWLTIAAGLAMELLAGMVIRDNLSLNIIMLVWPLDFIKQWQFNS